MAALETGQVNHDSQAFTRLIMTYVMASLTNRLQILKLNEQNINDAQNDR